MSQLHAERIIGLIGCSGDHRNKAVRVTPPQCDDTPGYGSVWMHGGIPTDPFSWISVFRQHLQGSISHTWNFWICDSIWFDSRSKEFEIKTLKVESSTRNPLFEIMNLELIHKKFKVLPCAVMYNKIIYGTYKRWKWWWSQLSMVHMMGSRYMG